MVWMSRFPSKWTFACTRPGQYLKMWSWCCSRFASWLWDPLYRGNPATSSCAFDHRKQHGPPSAGWTSANEMFTCLNWFFGLQLWWARIMVMRFPAMPSRTGFSGAGVFRVLQSMTIGRCDVDFINELCTDFTVRMWHVQFIIVLPSSQEIHRTSSSGAGGNKWCMHVEFYTL